MPSRHAHRHALRRSKEPLVITPPELDHLPELPADHGWRNPLEGKYFNRDKWTLYRLACCGSTDIARVVKVEEIVFECRRAAPVEGPFACRGAAHTVFAFAASLAAKSDFPDPATMRLTAEPTPPARDHDASTSRRSPPLTSPSPVDLIA